MNDLILEKKANDFRTQHGIGQNECIPIRALLYKLNILTVFKPMLSDSFSGMAIKVSKEDKSFDRFILVNSNQSIGRQNFSICHEIYHLFIQENFTHQVCYPGQFTKQDIEEYYADVFASFLLLSESGIKSLIPDEELAKDKIQLATILKIEQALSCSRAALLHRLKGLKIISSKGYDALNVNVKKGAVEFGYSTELYEHGNHNLVIGDYGRLARSLYDKEKISESHYYNLLFELGMNLEEIEKWGDEKKE